ncbi:transposase [Streptomyces sp. NPDC021608]|uniref:transposase n=1 Tax=Streptomyces sp. NPDC021608 TaxID=3154903 RepID=UPI003405EFCE
MRTLSPGIGRGERNLEARLGPARTKPLPRRGERWRDHREVNDAIALKYRTGVPWMDLPEQFGSWKGAHNRLRKWPPSALGRVTAIGRAGRRRGRTRPGSSRSGCPGEAGGELLQARAPRAGAALQLDQVGHAGEAGLVAGRDAPALLGGQCVEEGTGVLQQSCDVFADRGARAARGGPAARAAVGLWA